MTWMDDKVNGMFRTLLKLDGQAATYVRSEEKKRLRVLVDDVSVEETSADGISRTFQRKVLAFFTKCFPAAIGVPKKGDTVEMKGMTYDVVEGMNGRYFDYEDVSQDTMNVTIQLKGKKK